MADRDFQQQMIMHNLFLVATLLSVIACTADAPAQAADGATEVALATDEPETQGGRLRGIDPAAAAVNLAGDSAAVRRAAAEVSAGLTHANSRNPTAAAAAYARAAQHVPALQPWTHALSASAAARTGDAAAVQRHLAASDPAIARDWGWRARVEVALAGRDSAGAAQIAAEAAAAMPDTVRRAQAWVRAATIYNGMGRRTDAMNMARRAIDESVAPSAATEAARLLSGMSGLTAEDHRRIGRVFLRHRNMDRATAAYDAYIAAASPAAVLRSTIQLELGRGLFAARDYPGAERRLRQAMTSGGGETAAEATFMLGRVLYRTGRTDDARAAFLRVTREHAGTQAAARSHFMIADIDHDAGRVQSARTHYRAAVEADGPDAALAAARLGGFALLEGNARQAATIFGDAFRRATGNARQKPAYWWAHSLEAAGAADSARVVFTEARRMDPFSYYGLRAGERLGTDVWQFAASEEASADAGVRTEIAGRLDALDVLRAASLNEAADLEAARIVTRFTATEGGMYALGAAYHARGQIFNGVSIGRQLLRMQNGVWNRGILQLVYPFPYRDDVMRYSRANNLDPFLVAGLIRQESMFNTRARSPVGAIGLMQVMPGTGTTVARGLGISGFRPDRLTEPSINLRIGTKYLADQIRGYNGRLVDAIAAYNAGPSRVSRWRAFPEYAHPEIFTERIPFEETRNYVKIVQQNARIYRELYGD